MYVSGKRGLECWFLRFAAIIYFCHLAIYATVLPVVFVWERGGYLLTLVVVGYFWRLQQWPMSTNHPLLGLPRSHFSGHWCWVRVGRVTLGTLGRHHPDMLTPPPRISRLRQGFHGCGWCYWRGSQTEASWLPSLGSSVFAPLRDRGRQISKEFSRGHSPTRCGRCLVGHYVDWAIPKVQYLLNTIVSHF